MPGLPQANGRLDPAERLPDPLSDALAIFAVTIWLYMVAARCSPRSKQQNGHDWRSGAMPLGAGSAAVVADAELPVIQEPDGRERLLSR